MDEDVICGIFNLKGNLFLIFGMKKKRVKKFKRKIFFSFKIIFKLFYFEFKELLGFKGNFEYF